MLLVICCHIFFFWLDKAYSFLQCIGDWLETTLLHLFYPKAFIQPSWKKNYWTLILTYLQKLQAPFLINCVVLALRRADSSLSCFLPLSFLPLNSHAIFLSSLFNCSLNLFLCPCLPFLNHLDACLTFLHPPSRCVSQFGCHRTTVFD